MSLPGPTGQGPSADLKRSEALLREARAALRRLDTLLSDAQAAQDPVTPLVAEARSNLERVVGQLARRRSTDERRLRPASNVRTRQRKWTVRDMARQRCGQPTVCSRCVPDAMGFVGVGSISAEGRCRLNDRAPSKLGRCGDG